MNRITNRIFTVAVAVAPLLPAATGALAQFDSDPSIELGQPQTSPQSPGPELVPNGRGLVPIPPEPVPQQGVPASPREAEPASASGGYLGITTSPVPEALASHIAGRLYDGGGLLITRVTPNSPADAAGLRQNDILLLYGEQGISSFEDLVGLVRSDEPGQRVKLEIIRANTTQTVEATLGAAPPASVPPQGIDTRKLVPPVGTPLFGPGVPGRPLPAPPMVEATVISGQQIYHFLKDVWLPPDVQFAITQKTPYLMSHYRVVALHYGLTGPGFYQGVATLVDRRGNRFRFQAAGTLPAIKQQLVGQLLQLP